MPASITNPAAVGGRKFMSDYIADPDGFAALVSDPARFITVLRERIGEIGIVPTDASGIIVESLFEAARDADAAARLFACHEWTGIEVVDFREAGKADPWPNITVKHAGNQAAPFASDLDALAARTLPPTDDAMMAHHAQEAVTRLESWALWHAARAERRGIIGNSVDALCDLAVAASDLFLSVASGSDSEIISEHADAVYDAIDEAHTAAEREAAADTDAPRVAFGYEQRPDGDAFRQLIEFEEGPMRRLLRVFREIQEQRRLADDGAIDVKQAHINAMHSLAYAPPEPPPSEITP